MATTVDKSRRPASDVIKSHVPILSWLPSYQKGWLRGDVIAALTLWALLVPEAMAYAGIAGMPPETGSVCRSLGANRLRHLRLVASSRRGTKFGRGSFVI
jgi:hypothetical protein